MRFEGEVSKEENLLGAVVLDAKAVEAKEKIAAAKAAKQEMNQLSQQKAKLSNPFKRSSNSRLSL